jgi:hypothetical protein
MIPQMKTVIIALVLLSFVARAQTNLQGVSDFNTVLVTNWIKPGPYLRVVNGQLYNTAYSKLWGNPLYAMGMNRGPMIMSYSIKVAKIWNDRISCAVFKEIYKPETYTGVPQLEDEEFLKYVVIYHYPNSKSMTSGQELGDCRCMRVDNYITNGTSYVALDCGVQYTNLVPVVKKEVLTSTQSTNTPAKTFSH